MNVLFIAHYVELYGANRSMLTLIRGLQQNDSYTCHVVVPRTGPLTEELEKLGIGYNVCDIPWWFVRSHELKLDGTWYNGRVRAFLRWVRRELRAIKVIRRIARERNIDLVHTNSAVVSTGLLATRGIGLPHVWHLREYATLDYDLHPFLGLSMTRRIVAMSEAVICVSASISKYFDLSKRETAAVIFNGVATSEFIAMHGTARSSHAGRTTFAMVGVVSRTKGHAEAINALALVHEKWPDASLQIIGDGAVDELKELVKEKGLEANVHFHGYVKDVFPLLKSCGVLLMCSRNEAMGRVTAEAMCLGIPVIGYDAGGTAELIDHMVNGLLYSGGYQELAASMLQTIEDAALYEDLSRNALQKARDTFTDESYTQAVMDVYASAVAANH